MHYLDEGPRSEEAVVMLHGNPTWSFYYRNLVTLLAPRLRCIVPDHVGMGLSDKPQDYPYVLERRIQDIGRLIEKLGLKKVHLIAHDWGGAIGLGWAGRNPGMIGKITLLNTGAFLSKDIPFRISVCRWPFLGPILVRGINGFAGPAVWMAMSRGRLGRDERRAFLYPYGNWRDRVAIDAFVRDIPLEPSHPSYSTLAAVERNLAALREKPVRLIWGERDFCFHGGFRKRFEELLPQAKSLKIEDAGHYVIEDARAEVESEIRGFLA